MEDYLRRHGPSASAFTLAGQTLPGLIVSCYDGDTLTIVLPVALNQMYLLPVTFLKAQNTYTSIN